MVKAINTVCITRKQPLAAAASGKEFYEAMTQRRLFFALLLYLIVKTILIKKTGAVCPCYSDYGMTTVKPFNHMSINAP